VIDYGELVASFLGMVEEAKAQAEVEAQLMGSLSFDPSALTAEQLDEYLGVSSVPDSSQLRDGVRSYSGLVTRTEMVCYHPQS
jgi:hypothetical protein